MSYCGRSQGLGTHFSRREGGLRSALDGVWAGDCGAGNGGGTGFGASDRRVSPHSDVAQEVGAAKPAWERLQFFDFRIQKVPKNPIRNHEVGRPDSPASFIASRPSFACAGISITVKRETKGRQVIIKMQKGERLPT